MRYAGGTSCKVREKLSAWRRQCSEHERREEDDEKGESGEREWAVTAGRKEMSGHVQATVEGSAWWLGRPCGWEKVGVC